MILAVIGQIETLIAQAVAPPPERTPMIFSRRRKDWLTIFFYERAVYLMVIWDVVFDSLDIPNETQEWG